MPKKRSKKKTHRPRARATQAQKRKLFRDLDKRDLSFAEKVGPFLEGLYNHYFRCEIDGWDNVPEHKALYVGNHNGLLTFEVLMLFHAWTKRFGAAKKALGLAHSMVLTNPFFRWILPKIGAIPADPEIAKEALERDYSLLVYPGGEKESFRPYKERKKIDFYQRKGWIRLALSAGVPIVPIVSVGAHESYVILHRGEEIAEALGIKKRFRLHGFPITFRSVFFMWCVASGLVTLFPLLLAPAAFLAVFVPMPAKMNFHIMPEIDIQKLVDPLLPDEENHQRIYDHVLGLMQEKLTQEYAKRKLPVIG